MNRSYLQGGKEKEQNLKAWSTPKLKRTDRGREGSKETEMKGG